MVKVKVIMPGDKLKRDHRFVTSSYEKWDEILDLLTIILDRVGDMCGYCYKNMMENGSLDCKNCEASKLGICYSKIEKVEKSLSNTIYQVKEIRGVIKSEIFSLEKEIFRENTHTEGFK